MKNLTTQNELIFEINEVEVFSIYIGSPASRKKIILDWISNLSLPYVEKEFEMGNCILKIKTYSIYEVSKIYMDLQSLLISKCEYLNLETEFHFGRSQTKGIKQKNSIFELLLNSALEIMKNSMELKQNQSELDFIQKRSSLASILGAFLGDSMGSYYEFSNPNQNLFDSIVCFDKTTPNPVFSTSAGQLTDDSEMALSMAYGILDSQFNIDCNVIGYYYGAWLLSKPFDLGTTTHNALSAVKNKQIYNENFCEYLGKVPINLNNYMYFDSIFNNNIKKNAEKENKFSQSNGFLMRKVPISLYCLKYLKNEIVSDNESHLNEIDQFEQFNIEETELTHSNDLVKQISVLYSHLITRIIYLKTYYDGDFKTIIEKTLKFIEFYVIPKITDNLIKKINLYERYLNDLKLQVSEGKSEYIDGDFSKTQGFMGKSIFLIFHYFHKIKSLESLEKLSFIDIIKEIINRGGDTDTNCAIVMGVIAILYPFESLLYNKYVQIMLDFNPESSRVKRDFIFAPLNGVIYVDVLFKYLKNLKEINKEESKDNRFISMAVHSLYMSTPNIGEIKYI